MKELTVELRDRVVSRHGSVTGYHKCLQHWRSPRTQWPPPFLNGRSLEPPRPFLQLDKLRNRGRRALVREVTKNPMVTLTMPLYIMLSYPTLLISHRSVALTSIIMRCFERLICFHTLHYSSHMYILYSIPSTASCLYRSTIAHPYIYMYIFLFIPLHLCV